MFLSCPSFNSFNKQSHDQQQFVQIFVLLVSFLYVDVCLVTGYSLPTYYLFKSLGDCIAFQSICASQILLIHSVSFIDISILPVHLHKVYSGKQDKEAQEFQIKSIDYPYTEAASLPNKMD